MNAVEVLRSLAVHGVRVTLSPDGRPEAEIPAFAPSVVEDLLDEARLRRLEIAEILRGKKPVTGVARVEEDPSGLVCFSCAGSDFWQGLGLVVCRTCYPPAPGAEVRSRSRRLP